MLSLRMRNKRYKKSPSYLCEEILINILVRLPVKSLVRFTCVYKAWRHLILSSSFVSRHLSQVRKHSPTYIAIFRQGNRDKHKICYPLVFKETFMQCLESTHPLRTRTHLGIHGSSNGLLCISDRKLLGKSTICIWNPSIRKIRSLPAAAVQQTPCVQYDVTLSFGFHPIDDYKVVRMLHFRRAEGSFVVEVFSLSKGSWKTINSGFPCWLKSRWNWKCWSYEFLNGVVYWLIRKDDSAFWIVSFDTDTETFEEVAVPDNVCSSDSKITYFKYFCMKVYKESICLLRTTVRDAGNQHVNLWVLKQQSFKLLCTFDVATGEHSTPLRFKNDELLMLDENGDQNARGRSELISYNLESKQVMRTGIWVTSRGGCFCHPYTYGESLVLLDP